MKNETVKEEKITDSDEDTKDFPVDQDLVRKPPIKRPWKERIALFFYNSEEGSYLGRTPLSWIQIILFYICFYTCLLGFWLICWFVFVATSAELSEGPRWQVEKSIIGTNPGVGIRPKMKDEKLEQKANFMNKVTFSSSNKQVNNDYVDEIEKALKNYTLASSNFKVTELGECGDPPYGLARASRGDIKICVYLKLNRIWGWKPVPIDATDITKLRDVAKAGNKTLDEDFVRHWQSQDDKNFVWISCKTVKKEDREKFADFEYFPSNRGIDPKFFPFIKKFKEVQPPPLVAVMIKPNYGFEDETSVEIECRAFYKDVVHETKMGKLRGLILFELIRLK